jgi:hypothetical protein
VDKTSSKDRPNDSSYKDSLAQPLRLKDSLRIRDGLGGHDVQPFGWPEFRVVQLTAPDLSNLWSSNN